MPFHLLRRASERQTTARGNAAWQHDAAGHDARREPAFLTYLRSLRGRNVTLATSCGLVRGTLQAVFEDHVLLLANGVEHRVRAAQICFVAVTRAGR